MRLALLAWFAFFLGLLAIPFQAIAGIPALLLGFLTLRKINELDGNGVGRGPAIAALIIGAFGTVYSFLGFFWVVLASLWENSARLNCVNNLRSMGQATQFYFDSNNKIFPKPSLPREGLEISQRLSWLADPYFLSAKSKKAPDAKIAIDYTGAWNSESNLQSARQRVGHYQCPACNRVRLQSGESCTSYPGISGIGPESSLQRGVNSQSGFFNHNRSFGLKDFTRGLSNILQVVETDQTGPWIAAGIPTLRNLPMEGDKLIGVGAPFGGCHLHGANALNADGSIQFLKAGIDSRVFRAKATIQDPEEK